ncbi:MAG: dTDP-4-dehydrorhamnose 3,5-epimerase family protein, partial [Alphaproteobacteria bacterium]
CTRGAVFDVIVDLRKNSPTYLKWAGEELNSDNHRMLYVPEGCAHGYLTLSPNSEIYYLTSEVYSRDAARGIRYDDPAIGVVWPAGVKVISEADLNWPSCNP